MKKIVFCMISTVCVLSMGKDMQNNYYNGVATTFCDFSKIFTFQKEEIKITCFNIIHSTGSNTYNFKSSLGDRITAVVDNNCIINSINNFKAPISLLNNAKNDEWGSLSKAYFSMAISKISFFTFANIKVAKGKSIDFIVENIDNNYFSIFCPQSKRKRMVRYSSNKILQLRDYIGDQIFQEFNFFS